MVEAANVWQTLAADYGNFGLVTALAMPHTLPTSKPLA
jgi:hypothetical protein